MPGPGDVTGPSGQPAAPASRQGPASSAVPPASPAVPPASPAAADVAATVEDLQAYGELIRLDRSDPSAMDETVRAMTRRPGESEADFELRRGEEARDVRLAQADAFALTPLAKAKGRQAAITGALILLVVLLALAAFAYVRPDRSATSQGVGRSDQAQAEGAAGSGPIGPSGAAWGAGASLVAGAWSIPSSCALTADQVGLGLVDPVVWDDQSDGLAAQWALTASNPTSDRYAVYIHKIDDAYAATKANKWQPQSDGWFMAADTEGTEPRGNITGVEPRTSQARLSGSDALVYTSVEADLPTLCSYAYVDRVVAIWDRPGCTDVLWDRIKPLARDPAAQEAILAPWAITAPQPSRMNGWSCPQ
jgi:hypothetical protein